MEQLPAITLRKGATSVVSIDLTGFEMQGGYVALTVSDKKYSPLRSWKMDEARVWDIVIPDEFTADLKVGEENYLYDIMWHLGGERFAQCAPSPVKVEATAGGYPHDPDNAE